MNQSGNRRGFLKSAGAALAAGAAISTSPRNSAAYETKGNPRDLKITKVTTFELLHKLKH